MNYTPFSLSEFYNFLYFLGSRASICRKAPARSQRIVRTTDASNLVSTDRNILQASDHLADLARWWSK